MSLHGYGLTDLIRLLWKKETSPLEIVTDLLDAIQSRNTTLNAYLEVPVDKILESARQLTCESNFKEKPLCGVPVAVKDNICVKGLKTTCGSRSLENYNSPYSATAVEKLLSSGALVAGKTNLDEFAMGSSTEYSAFGPTKNPWDLERTSGGSSGGSAAAVAAGIAPCALGSDTGGSIRQPACFCGVVGMKPTYGTVSRYGLVAFASSLDQIGPITKNVKDCALLLSVISGFDSLDATSLEFDVPDLFESLERGLENLTVGVPLDFVGDHMDNEVKRNFDAVVKKLESQNVRVVEIALPYTKYSIACYYIIAVAEASANLARYDGVRYGYRAEAFEDLYEMYTCTRGEGFGEEVQRRVLLGTFVLSSGYYEEYYLKAQKMRSLIFRDFESAFEKCDLLMIPVSPTPAFKLGEKISDPLLMYLSDVFTIPANLTGLPAISIPSGLTKDKLPIAVQLIGRRLEDKFVLRGAYGMEQIVDFRETPPDVYRTRKEK